MSIVSPGSGRRLEGDEPVAVGRRRERDAGRARIGLGCGHVGVPDFREERLVELGQDDLGRLRLLHVLHLCLDRLRLLHLLHLCLDRLRLLHVLHLCLDRLRLFLGSTCASTGCGSSFGLRLCRTGSSASLAAAGSSSTVSRASTVGGSGSTCAVPHSIGAASPMTFVAGCASSVSSRACR